MLQSEDILHDERERLRVTLSSIGDAVITTDVKGLITFMNTVAESLTGWTLAEASGISLERAFRIVNEDTREAVENPVTKTLREGVIVGLANHTVLIAKDGTERPIDDSSAPIISRTGEIAGVVLVFRDVTERRRAENILRESEERFRLLVEGVQDYAIVMLDPHGIVVSWNSGAERIKGYRADEIIGEHFSCFYSPDIASTGFPDNELDTARKQGRFEDEGWRLRKDGSTFWAHVVIAPLRDERGALKGFAKVTRDLTERRAAVEALRARERRFRALTETANDAVVAADQSGRIISWNPAATTAFQYAEDEAIGRPLTLLMPERYRQAHEAGWERLRSTGQSRLIGSTIELEGRRKDGSEFPIELSLAAWKTEEGQFYAGIIRDITERKQKEQALRQAEVLAALNSRKDEFLAMLSHEMRNPLAPISSAVQLLRIGNETNPVRQQAMDILERQVSTLTRLVDDLLRISHIATGRIGLQQERFDMRQVTQRAVELVRPLIVEQKHKLSVSLGPDPIWLFADPVRIEQVLVNLLTNAAKYTNVGGRIGLTVEREGNEMVLRVTDNGVGIAADFLPSVFDLFTQAKGSLGRSQGGLGVGLTIVQRIVEMHGGNVVAFSPGPGHGSEFTVRLPVAQVSMQTSEAPSLPDADTVPKSRVLVVDDNEDAANSIALLLRHAGHDVQVAYGGEAAIESALSWLPDAILLDIGLPDVDGYEVARRLRRDPKLDAVRLVAITGYGRETDRQRAEQVGFDAYLVKPADPKKIQELLAHLTRRHQAT